MMRLHDNLSSGNGYKVRLLLAQLGADESTMNRPANLETGTLERPGPRP